MGTSIKRSVNIRVICAVVAVILFSCVTTMNILRIESTQDASAQASALLDSAQKAEVAQMVGQPEQRPLRRYRVHRQHGSHQLRPGQVAVQ